MSEGGWLAVREKGSAFGVRLLMFMLRTFGRRAARVVLRFVVGYYVLVHRGVRRVSRDYLRRLGSGAGLSGVYRHLKCFAECTLDRFALVAGRSDGFDVRFHGMELLEQAHAEGRGAVLLGAHVGSFEVLRVFGDQYDLPIHVVGYFRNAPMINEALRGADTATGPRLVELDEADLSFVLKMRQIVEAGGMLGILGDRIGPAGGRSVQVPFLGAPARFPTGVHRLAAALGCPVMLVFGLYRGGNRYDLYCEPFAERVELPRQGREEALRDLVQRYAARVEHYCRMAPYNWFNFFDFWSSPSTDPHA